MEKLTVLFISHEDSQFGAPKSLMELVKNLKDNYNVYPILLLHSKDDVYRFCKKEQIECYVTRHRNVLFGNRGLNGWIKFLPKLIRDIYDDHRALKIASKINFDKVDIIHSNVSIIRLGLLLGKKYNVPSLIHLRESSDLIKNYGFIFPNYINYMNKNTTKFIAISQYSKRGWEQLGLDTKKIDIVFNGLKLGHKIDRTIFNDKVVKIVMIGSLSEKKSQLTLLKAISYLSVKDRKKIQVDIIGSGEKRYLRKLKRVKKNNNLINVNFLGYKSDISTILNTYDIGVMASINEAFGRVTVEYMAHGLCVLGANCGATPEIIKDNESGYLFKKEDSSQLSRLISYVINHKTEAQRIARCGQKRVYSNFTTNINTENVYKEYLKVKK